MTEIEGAQFDKIVADRESEIEQLKETVLKLQEQVRGADELVRQLQGDSEAAAKKVAFIFSRLAYDPLIDSDTAELIASRRDELDAPTLDLLAVIGGGSITREEVLELLNERARKQGGQTKEG